LIQYIYIVGSVEIIYQFPAGNKKERIMSKYSQTCIKSSFFGQRESGLIRQVTA